MIEFPSLEVSEEDIRQQRYENFESCEAIRRNTPKHLACMLAFNDEQIREQILSRRLCNYTAEKFKEIMTEINDNTDSNFNTNYWEYNMADLLEIEFQNEKGEYIKHEIREKLQSSLFEALLHSMGIKSSLYGE